MKSYGTSCVKRNGIPHNLYLLRRNTAILQKSARCVSPVHFEPIMPRVSFGQTQVMENCGYCQKFRVWCRLRAL